MNIQDIFQHTFRVLDQRDPRSAATAPVCNRAEQEGSSPTDDAGTAGVVLSQYRARIYQYERLIERLHDLMREGRDIEAFDLVSDEYRAIHGVG
jgi:hypothetical protein